jgi:hypothetical protein
MLPPPQFCDAHVYWHRQAKDVFTSMLTTSGLHLGCCCCCAGPGCSSLAYGFGQEIGPYFINPNGTDGLSLNPYAWNTGTSTLIMSSCLFSERICTLIMDIMFCKSWIGLILPFSLLVGNIFVGRVEYAVAGISNRSRLLLLQEQRD